MVYGNSTTRSFTYDAVSRLSGITLDANGTTDDETYGFTYNSASQLVSQTSTNSAYDFALGAAFNDGCAAPSRRRPVAAPQNEAVSISIRW
jgi:hypothetical protein